MKTETEVKKELAKLNSLLRAHESQKASSLILKRNIQRLKGKIHILRWVIT